MSATSPDPRRIRGGFTLIEMLVAITIFTVLSLLVTYVFNNVSRVADRTQTLMQLHHEAGAILRTIEADLQQLQPHVAMRLAEFPGDVSVSPTTAPLTHLTFMRSHGDPTGPSLQQNSTARDSYQHDLVWVRWQADRRGLRRSVSPEWPRHLGLSGGDQGGILAFNSAEQAPNGHADLDIRVNNDLDGRTPSPQQFYEFFEPAFIPERALGNTGGFTLGELGARYLHTDVYPWPSKLWWLPDPQVDHNRGQPGSVQRIHLEPLEDLGTFQAGDISFVGTTPMSPYFGDPSRKRVAFSVTNPRGYTANRDFINLVGVHPDAHDERHFASRLTVVNDQVLNFRVSLHRRGRDSSLLPGGSDTPLAAGAFAGLPMNPSADNPLTNTLPVSQRLDTLIHTGGTYQPSKGFADRPGKIEIAFVIHNMPSKRLDDYDHDGDGDRLERLSQAIYDRVVKDTGTPVDNDDLVRAFNQVENHVAVSFRHAVVLPR